MDERRFVWDEITEGLILLSTAKAEDEQAKGQKTQATAVHTSKIYCPHAYLILNYQDMLNDSEKIKFRKYYLRKVKPSEPDVIILQDIKDLVLFLLTTPVSPQFINFFHLPIVDRFLRALILYFQHYVEIWEDLMQERAATMRKAPNPLARGHRTRYAEEMRTLRCILGREYVDLIMGCQSGSQYHHMMTGERRSSIAQSQGEKDLRIFEALISVAHQVVWIALQRKHYNLIELEVHRLLRTEAYNTAQRQSGNQIIQEMLEDDIRILYGPKMPLRSKLLRNSPLPHELMYSDCDYRLLSLGIVKFDIRDPNIAYLKNALLIEEDKLPQLGIRVGILGHNRSNYDIMLMPSETEELESIEINTFDKKAMELQKSILSNKIPDIKKQMKKGLFPYKSEYELVEKFPVKEIEVSIGKYDKVRREARRKWIVREMKRRHKPFDT